MHHPPAPPGDRGTWVPADLSAAQRATTERHGIRYDDVYTADAARRRVLRSSRA